MTSLKLRTSLWVFACFIAASLTVLWLGYHFHERALEEATRKEGFATAASCAGTISRKMADMEQVAHDLASALSSGKLPPDQVQAAVATALEKSATPILRMGVLYRPGSTGHGRHLFGPYAERVAHGVRRYFYEESSDYSVQDWFIQEPWRPGWHEPRFSHRGGWLMVDFVEPFQVPGARTPSGLVRLNVSLTEVQAIVDDLDLGHTGFAYLLSAKGAYMAHPLEDLVLSGKTILDRAEGDGKKRLADLVTRKESGFTHSTSSSTGQKTLVFLQRIPSLGWFVGLAYPESSLHEVASLDRALLALRLSLALVLALVLIFLAFRGHRPGRANLWWAVGVGSMAMVVANGILFHYVNAMPAPKGAYDVSLMDRASLEKFKLQNATQQVGVTRIPMTFIPTGVYLQTLEAAGPGLTKVTGQIWQRLPKGTPRDQRGIVFPEATAGEATLGIERLEEDHILQFYTFRVVVREEANSDHYPFDRTKLRLRIWPRPFLNPEILVPDLDAYTVLTPESLPGADPEIELPGWRLEATEFGFTQENYTTRFGLDRLHGHNRGPEMLYSITLKRAFGSPFIAAFLPILAVAGLLFTLVLTVSRLGDKVKATGYSYLNFLRTTIALFFSLVVAQFNIRNRIIADGVICLEWYFFIMYAAILVVSIDALVFALRDHPVLSYEDNAFAKLAFWPVLLACFYVNSLFFLW
ncbi:MAG: Cache 3/Cache 2 fusion domain-containing protein [Holophaga sp.]|nr:Cache 3/Cache 2 fusion domain-containing protein [Holophaga sp.]